MMLILTRISEETNFFEFEKDVSYYIHIQLKFLSQSFDNIKLSLFPMYPSQSVKGEFLIIYVLLIINKFERRNFKLNIKLNIKHDLIECIIVRHGSAHPTDADR